MLESTLRERFMGALDGVPVGRIPEMDFGYWDETIEVWHAQGLPDVVVRQEDVEDYLGLDRSYEFAIFLSSFTPGAARGLYPRFEPEILQDEGDIVLMRDEDGTILRQKKRMKTIPQYVSFPVSNMTDYEALRWRLDGRDRRRYPADWQQQTQCILAARAPIGLRLDGFFGWPRKLVGLEALALAFYDQPELITTINREHTQFLKDLVLRALNDLPVDYALIWEDMAYKNGSLISPRMFHRFLTPYYEELVAFLREHGVQKILVDCDGDVRDLVGLFREVGVDGLYPCERAAGSDPVELRRRYPGFALLGGVDKRALLAGPDAIESELTHLRPVIAEGGFIPGVDHRVPPDVPFSHYRYFCERRRELLATVCG